MSLSTLYAPDHPPRKPCPRYVSEDDITRLLADHVHGSDDEKAWNAGEHRRIHQPQVFCPVHAELAIHDRHPVVSRPHLAGTGGVMAPRLVLDELPDLLPCHYALSRHHLLLDDPIRMAHHSPDEFHPFDYRLQVVSA